MEKKIAVVGVGGRTGTLFAEELGNGAAVLGIGRESAVKSIKSGKVFISKDEGITYKFNCKTIAEKEVDKAVNPDFIFLATKNPVSPSIKYYYEKVDHLHLPDLILPQNGFLAADEAYEELERMFGNLAKDIKIIRVALFNAVSSKAYDEKITISYSLPIRLAFGVAYGPNNLEDLEEMFNKAKIEAYPVPQDEIKNMEYSKLFTNLIGVASFAHGMSIEEGFNDKETFLDEISVLKEYIRVVQKNNGRFLNFKHYPIGAFAFIVNKLPTSILSIFSKQIARIISSGRRGRTKGNIDEIYYYNGAVVKLGGELGVATPTNKKIYKIIKERL